MKGSKFLFCLLMLTLLAVVFSSCDLGGDIVLPTTASDDAEETSMPDEETTDPDEETTVPDEETTDPNEETTVPDEETTDPNEEETLPHEHVWSDWSTVTSATCTVDGQQERSCVCGEKETEILGATGHTEVVDVAVAPTCTVTGLTAGKHCSVCDEVLVAQTTVAALGHTEVVDNAIAPTCTATGLTAGKHCSVCDEVLVAQTTVAALGHTEVVDAAVAPTCTATGLTAGKHCSVCDEVLVAQTIVAALGHTEVVDVAVAPTCTETGLTAGKHCSVCDEVLVAQTTVAALGHTEVVDVAVAPTCTATGLTAGKHCSVCEEVLVAQTTVAALGHTEVVDVAVAPTCTATGLTAGKHCSVCDEVLVAQTTVAALGHTEVVDAAVAPTCTATGLTAGKHCSVCEEVLVAQTIVAALGHTEVVDVAVAPTCTATGLTAGKHCSVCDEVLVAQTIVAALGHTEVVDAAVAPTCTATGLTAGKHCSVCDEVLVAQTTVAALGHTEVVDNAIAPTCTETGLTAGKHCSVCDEVLVAQTTVAALGHTEVVDAAVAPTCTATGLTAGKHCSVCDEVLVAQTVVAATGHQWGDLLSIKMPTCTEKGLQYRACEVCYHPETTYVDALGHDSIMHEAQAPTCTLSGCTAYETCSRCDYTTYSTVSALGHDLIDHDARVPSCTEIGWEAYQTCSRCDHNTYIEIPQQGHDIVIHDSKRVTCLEDGWNAYRTCQRCDYTTFSLIKAPGAHKFSEAWNVDLYPTEETCGSRSHHCENFFYCQEKGSVTEIPCLPYTDFITYEYNAATDSYVVTGIESEEISVINLSPIFHGKKVTAIADSAFEGNTKIERITLSSNIERVGNRAFYNCERLVLCLINSEIDFGEDVFKKETLSLESKPCIDENFDSLQQYGETVKVSTDMNPNNVLVAHTYSKLVERDIDNKYLLIPFKGIANALRLKLDEYGNPIYEYKLVDGKKVSLPIMVPFLNEAGEEVKDAEGNTLYVQETEIVMDKVMVEKKDEEGNIITDIYGEPVMEQAKDEEGNLLFAPRMEIAYKYKLDEYGRPMREFTEVQKDGTYGDYVYELDANGNKIYDTVPKLDENGEPVLDANGNPVMVPETRPVVKFVTCYEQTQAKEKYSEGNVDRFLKLNNQSVSADDKGVILELDMMIHYDYLSAEDCGYEYDGYAQDPTAEIMFARVNHTKFNNAVSTANISMAKINLKTGALTNVGSKVPGAANLKQDTWYTIRFEIDLVSGTYNTFITNLETGATEQYALFGFISNNNNSNNLKNISIDAGQLIIAKCNNNTGAYDNVDSDYEDMTYIGVDNVKMYTVDTYKMLPTICEYEIPNRIAGDNFNAYSIDMSPKAFGYVSAPDTARVVADPTDPTGEDKCIRVDFRGYRGDNPDGYYIWTTTNSYGAEIKDFVIETDENGKKILTGTAGACGMVSGMIWGDDEIERLYKINSIPNPDYDFYDPDSSQYLTEYNISEANVTTKPSGLYPTAKIYIVTSEFYDAMMGGANVARSFAPGNPMLSAETYGKYVTLQVRYYVSADAVGSIEMQMNSSNTSNGSNSWIDTVQVKALKDGRVQVVYGGNYQVVAGPTSGVEVNRNEWFTIHVVIDLETQWEDIYLNGEYLYTLKPKNDFNGYAIRKDSWSIAKVIRNNVPGNLAGYFLVDDVMIFEGTEIVDEFSDKVYSESFDDLTADSDLSMTDFAENIPSSVVFYDDSANGHDSALKLDLGLDLGLDLESVADKKIFWSKTEGATAVYEEGTYRVVHKAGKHVLQLNGKNASGIFDEIEFVGVEGESEIWHLTKGGVTYVYEETSYEEYAIYMMCLGENTNRDWTFANPAVGATLYSAAEIQFDIYLSEEAAGRLQGRIKSYTDGTAKLVEGIALYSIDTETGSIGFGENTAFATLNKGEWNTVTFVLDPKTGDATISVNGDVAVEGTIDAENISFFKNQWVLAKIVAGMGEAESLAGYVLFDNISFTAKQ